MRFSSVRSVRLTSLRRRCLPLLAAGALVLLATASPAQEDDFLRPSTPLPIPRAFHGAAVLKDYLYVFGGSIQVGPGNDDQAPGTETHVARIGADGNLSRFVKTTPMPVARNYINNSTVVLNDTVYVIGGSTGIESGERLNTVAYTKPQANGMLEPWRESPPYDEVGVNVAAAFATPGYLQLTGGLKPGGEVLMNTYACRIDVDGSLIGWEPSQPLPKPLWFHCAAVVGGRAYIWGGLDRYFSTRDADKIVAETAIYSAPVLGNGKLGPWRKEPLELPVPFYGASVAVAGPYLFSLCPRYNGAKSNNDIWWTMVTPQGMRPWSRRPTTLPIRVQHAAATDYRRGLIFFPGGKPSTGENPINVTAMIRLSPKAQAQAESLWQQQEQAHRSSFSMRQIFDPSAADSLGASGSASVAATLPGFMEFSLAREMARLDNQPLLVYFGTPDAKISRDQDALLTQTNLDEVKKQALLSYVNVKNSPQDAQQYGVYRVPTWIVYDATGNELAREVGVCTMQELQGLMRHVRG